MNDSYEEIYLRNENLVYKFATQYKLLNNEDMMQNLKLAMFRAIKKYNPEKGVALSTYVYVALFHEYKYSFRDKNLKIDYVDNVVADENGKESSIFDFIADNKTVDIDYEIDKQEIFKIIFNYLDTCEPEHKNMFLDYYFKNVKQKELAKIYGLSQGQISRKIKMIVKCLQELLKDYK